MKNKLLGMMINHKTNDVIIIRQKNHSLYENSYSIHNCWMVEFLRLWYSSDVVSFKDTDISLFIHRSIWFGD